MPPPPFPFRIGSIHFEWKGQEWRVRGRGTLEREHRGVCFFLFIFPFILRPRIIFPFFPFFFPYSPSFSFIHHYFNSCIGRVQLIYTFAFFIFAIQFGLFFSLSSPPYNYLDRSCFCLFLLAIFASFYFFPGIISITKTKNWQARAIWCFLNLFYFVSFTL